jgi:hypothetical protein
LPPWLDRAFQHIAHAQILADRLGVYRLALEGHGRVARNDEVAGNAREAGGQFVSERVDEVILRRIAAEIGEGQHHNGEMRGRNGRLGVVGHEEIPDAGDQDEQRGDPGAEQREPRGLFLRGRLFGRLRLRRRLRLPRLAYFKRIEPHRFGNVLELRRTKIGDREIEPRSHLTVGVLGKTDAARLGQALHSRGNVDAVAHQIAIALFDDVAQMYADAKLDAAFGRHAGVTLDHTVLHFDCQTHRVHDAAELHNGSVAGALDDAAMVHGDYGINQIAADRPEPRQGSVFICSGEPAVTDHVRDKDRRDLPGLAHSEPPPLARSA